MTWASRSADHAGSVSEVSRLLWIIFPMSFGALGAAVSLTFLSSPAARVGDHQAAANTTRGCSVPCQGSGARRLPASQ
ncbi:hypothetical protein QBC34DRAFT_390115 [Podospora aff. communis PSN243]|uniref:Uncharacterized protein n=1 Tax=Podospora aff. communis PSN243 TaxID=3040156 RepID=A0AAV9H5D8_9PEZI|nr:hypothetical protein QBC34DRAFT_390115 [Podospora aff. communis PSN243]